MSILMGSDNRPQQTKTRNKQKLLMFSYVKLCIMIYIHNIMNRIGVNALINALIKKVKLILC